MRDDFDLPDGLVYLDGNSLGALPRGVAERAASVVSQEWGRGLIRSWNDAGWIRLVRRVADRLAPLLGVEGDDVHLGESTSVSLFKLAVAAARLRPGRRVLVCEPTTFPTDGYVLAGVADLLGLELRWCDPADPAASVDDDVALLCLTHVDFRTGAAYDLPGITARAQQHGALVLWDLCHSTGAVPVDLTAAGADMAVGCTYKYLNGGPGSPAYLWVAPELQHTARQPIPGWMGHARPFGMERDHEPAPGIGAFASGTPPVLALSVLEESLRTFEGIDVQDLRAHSLAMTDLFVAGLDRLGLDVVTPREHARRGSQVSFRHDRAYAVVQALIARDVIGDFRDPDIARFGFAPLYNTTDDVDVALQRLALVLEHGEHLDPAYDERNAVT